MRILTVSDKVEPVLYGPYIRERVGQIDLILACGDLPYYYLDYIVSLLGAPLYFVHGNHDQIDVTPAGDRVPGSPTPLAYGVNLHMSTVEHPGLLLAGMEGCRAYNLGPPFQYSESETKVQALRLGRKLLWNRVRQGRYLDILATHAPPRGIHDDVDLPHQGFVSYLKFLRRFRPTLMIHGHQHIYNRNLTTETVYEGTRVINTYGYRVLELTRRRDGPAWELVSSGR